MLRLTQCVRRSSQRLISIEASTKTHKPTITKFIEACNNLDEKTALSELKTRTSLGYKPSEFDIGQMLSMYYKMGDLTRATKLYTNMHKEYNIQPTPSHDRILLNTAVKTGNVTTAREYFDQIPNKTEWSYVTMLNVYAQAIHEERGTNYMKYARQLFDEMKTRNMLIPAAYNVMIQGYSALKMEESGEQIYKEAIENRCTNNITHGIMLHLYCECDDLQKAEELYYSTNGPRDLKGNTMFIELLLLNNQFEHAEQILKDAKMTPDMVIFSAMISCHLRRNKPDKAEQLIEKMKEYGYEPGLQIWTSVLDYICKKNVDEGYQRFLSIENKDERVYQTMIKYFVFNGRIGQALELVQTMIDANIQPTSGTFVYIMRSYVENREYRRAIRLYQNMGKKYKAKPTAGLDTYLINALLSLGYEREAVEVFKKADALNVKSYSLMIQYFMEQQRPQETTKLLIAMKREGILSPQTMESILETYFSHGFANFAVDLYKQAKMRSPGIDNVMLKHYVETDPEQAWEFFQTMQRNRFSYDILIA
jgi:pentatricopeptide repeat protein